MQDALQSYHFDHYMHYSHSGMGDIITSAEYRMGIIKFLKTLNDDFRLDAVGEKLGEHIHSVHFEKFRRWPRVGSTDTQESKVILDICDWYNYEQYGVAWSCLRYITV